LHISTQTKQSVTVSIVSALNFALVHAIYQGTTAHWQKNSVVCVQSILSAGNFVLNTMGVKSNPKESARGAGVLVGI
jgi:hypothetical protein